MIADLILWKFNCHCRSTCSSHAHWIKSRLFCRLIRAAGYYAFSWCGAPCAARCYTRSTRPADDSQITFHQRKSWVSAAWLCLQRQQQSMSHSNTQQFVPVMFFFACNRTLLSLKSKVCVMRERSQYLGTSILGHSLQISTKLYQEVTVSAICTSLLLYSRPSFSDHSQQRPPYLMSCGQTSLSLWMHLLVVLCLPKTTSLNCFHKFLQVWWLY